MGNIWSDVVLDRPTAREGRNLGIFKTPAVSHIVGLSHAAERLCSSLPSTESTLEPRNAWEVPDLRVTRHRRIPSAVQRSRPSYDDLGTISLHPATLPRTKWSLPRRSSLAPLVVLARRMSCGARVFSRPTTHSSDGSSSLAVVFSSALKVSPLHSFEECVRRRHSENRSLASLEGLTVPSSPGDARRARETSSGVSRP